MLTIYLDSALYEEIQRGNWQEEVELKKYREVRMLIEKLQIPTIFAGMGAFYAFPFCGQFSKDRKKLLSFLDEIAAKISEEELQQYRKSVYHL